MFNLFKSSEEKRQEQIAAYIDQQMGAAERGRFEAELKQDAALQEMLEAQQEVKSLLSQMPKLKAPRNFVLDPAVYGGKAPAPSLLETLYPKMRLATAAASFLFVIALGAGVLLNSPNLSTSDQNVAMAPAASPAEEVAPIAQEGIPTQMPQPTLAASAEKSVEVEAESAAVIEQENFSVAADSADAVADEAGSVEDLLDEAPSAEAGLMAESDASEEIVSPRALEPELLEGERMAEPEVPIAPEATPTQAIAQQSEQTEGVDTESARAKSSVDDMASDEISTGEAAPDWISIALWALGILVLVLIVATLTMRSRID